MFVNWIDKILSDDMCTHLQPTDIGIKFRSHVFPREVACGTQFAGYHAAMLAQGSQYEVFNSAFFRYGMLTTAPVAEVRPPLTADKSRFAGKEVAIDAVAVAHHRTLPLPQRPFL